MSAILVYGAAGFVAATLARGLASELQDRLILVDHREVPADLCTWLSSQGAEFAVYRTDSLRTLPRIDDLSAAVVLAGQTDVDEALVNPARAFESNIKIAIDAGEWLRGNPRARLVYVSSDEVLGESFIPLDESAPHRPTQPYAASKAAAELVLHCYRDTYGLDVVTVRSCNLVGGRQRARKLIPTAVAHLTAGRPVPLFGAGTHCREWLAVEDLCDALCLVIRREDASGVYHCGSGRHLTVLEVIRLVADALNAEAHWRQVPDRRVHDRSYAMSCSRIRELGWSPRRDVTDSIKCAATAIAAAAADGDCPLFTELR
jgi:dTDP-glucose 4,6-dehydratase